MVSPAIQQAYESNRTEEDVRSARDARLAAAAPDLLEALKAFIAPSHPMRPTPVAPLVERAKAAIFKAEGRLP